MPSFIPTSLKDTYQDWLKQGFIEPDEAQCHIIDVCQEFQNDFSEYYKQTPFNLVSNFLFRRKTKPALKGLYIYGDVGRGKSMLMDLLFETILHPRKRRVHFHAFMQEIHQTLHLLRQTKQHLKDPIPVIAKQISAEIDLLCFDEFHITDITDAMIMSRLFSSLFSNQVTIVATSNVAPTHLYKDGLQRENFLPFIDILLNHTTTLPLNSPNDYRLRHLTQIGHTYLIPHNSQTEKQLKNDFDQLIHHATPHPSSLTVNGRILTLNTTHGDVLLSSFTELCIQALGPADYIEIACNFSTVILLDIPYFTPDLNNEAKRFITLIDELYEHKVKLLCSAASSPELLYQDGKYRFEFKRTISRLIEMQSPYYLALPKN